MGSFLQEDSLPGSGVTFCMLYTFATYLNHVPATLVPSINEALHSFNVASS